MAPNPAAAAASSGASLPAGRTRPRRRRGTVCLSALAYRVWPDWMVQGPRGMSFKVDSLQYLGDRLTGGLLEDGSMVSTNALPPARSCAREVPKILHFIWLLSPLREPHAQNILGFAEKNPAWRVWVWVDQPIKNTSWCILKNADRRPAGRVMIRDVRSERHRFRNWDIIEQDQNGAGKSDYLRHDIIYLHGGIYLDCDSVALRGFDEYGQLFRWPFVVHTLGSELRGVVYNDLCNCIFGAERTSSFLNFTLSAMRQNCVKFGSCGVLGAGPGAFTAMFLRYNQPDIALISQDYMLRLDGKVRGRNIMYQRFEASWVTGKHVTPHH